MRDDIRDEIEGNDSLHPHSGEQSLWRAVITQALMDASSKSKKMEMKYEKSQALCWITGYGEDFKTVCDFAGYAPDYIRENSIEAIKRDCKWRADPATTVIKSSNITETSTPSYETKSFECKKYPIPTSNTYEIREMA